MQFFMNQKELIAALDAVQFAVSPRSTLPILANVKITASEEKVCFATTNLEVYAEYTVPCNVSESGAVTVNQKELLALVKPLKSEMLRFHLVAGLLSIASDFVTSSLDTIDAEEFPQGPRFSAREAGSSWVTTQAVGKRPVTCKVTHYECEKVTLPVQDFQRALALVGYAAAPDESRPVLTGLYLDAKDNVLTLVAADAFRLCLKEIPVAGSWSRPVLPPAKGVLDAFKRFPKPGELTISVEESHLEYIDGALATSGHQGPHIFFRSGPLEVAMRLIDGQYPPYQAIIPKEGAATTKAIVPAASLRRALDAVKIIASDASNITKLHLNGGITVKAQREGMAEPVTVEVQAQITGKKLEVLYNWRYLYQIVASSPKSQITLNLTSPTRPATFTLDDVPGFVAVLMPMHLNR